MRYFENEPNERLLSLYKDIMVSNFHSQRSFIGTYRPKYEHNCIYLEDVPKHFPFRLYNSTSEKILEEINFRIKEGSFYQMAWWTSRGILSTKISYPALWKRQEVKSITSIKEVNIKEKETVGEWLTRVSYHPKRDFLQDLRFREKNEYWLKDSARISLYVLSFLRQNNLTIEQMEDELGMGLDLSSNYDYRLSEICKIKNYMIL